jgi:two-component system copper resistance phosphate regulon response regulator CusR
VRTVLVADDEPALRRFVARALEVDGHRAVEAEDGTTALDLALRSHFDLLVVDLLMPGLSGFGVLERLAEAAPQQRVLVLSAVSDVETRVRCLQLGASDFLSKPFARAELVARVRTRLRETTGPAPAEPERFLRVKGISLDLRRREVELDGQVTPLPQREFLLLAHLMRRVGEVCTRDELLTEVWGFSSGTASNVVDVYVGRLRRRLPPERLLSVRHVGYVLHSS